MQQTEKYKLNKPEGDDPLAIAPLNENMDKVEAAVLAEAAERVAGIAAEAAARAAGDAALDARVTVLEATRLVSGTYKGSGTNAKQTITLGFTPIAVAAATTGTSTGGACLTILNTAMLSTSTSYDLKIVKNGFSAGENLNNSYYTYNYVAIG